MTTVDTWSGVCEDDTGEDEILATGGRGAGAFRDTGHVIRVARVACSAVLILTYGQIEPAPLEIGQLWILLFLHLAFAAAATAAVRRFWWLDPVLAPVETLIDFLVIVVALHATGDLFSPFFIFSFPLFMSVLLRWGWRETLIVVAAFALTFAGDAWTGRFHAPASDVDGGRLLARCGALAILVLAAAWLGRHPRTVVLPNPRILPDDTDPVRTLLQELGRLVGAGSVTLATLRDHDAICVRSTDPELDGTSASFAPDQLLEMTRPFLFQVDPPRKMVKRGWLFGRGTLSRHVRAHEVLASLRAESGLIVPVSTRDLRGIVLISRTRNMTADLLELAPWIAGRVAAVFLDELRFHSIKSEALAQARLRAAQDVHDTVVQALAGTVFRLEALKSWIAAGRDPLPEIERLSDDVRGAQGKVRDYIGQLRVPFDTTVPCDLLAEIRAAADTASHTWGIACRTIGPRDPISAPAWLGQELAMIVAESASNAVRHGEANTVTFTLRVEDGSIELTIEDNGHGFPRARWDFAAPWSLNRRVLALGGTLTLLSSGGTRIVVNIPFGGSSDQT